MPGKRLVHADPHPGNFLILPDGRLGVLDFGATRLLSNTFAEVYRGLPVGSTPTTAAGRRSVRI